MKYVAKIDGREFEIEILDENHVIIDNTAYEVDFQSVSGQPVYSLLIDGESFEGHVYPTDEGWQVLLRGNFYPIEVEDERDRRMRAAMGGRVSDTGEFPLKAPMPGLVVSIPVSIGQKVEKGDVLLVLESMKMQNELKSPREGVIKEIRAKAGESVEQKYTLLIIE
jgi:biotin carboxyl carrier protein